MHTTSRILWVLMRCIWPTRSRVVKFSDQMTETKDFRRCIRVQTKWRRDTVDAERILYSKTLVYGNGKAKNSQYYHNIINRNRKRFSYYKFKKKIYFNSVWKKFSFINKSHVAVFIIFSIYRQSLNKNIASNVY